MLLTSGGKSERRPHRTLDAKSVRAVSITAVLVLAIFWLDHATANAPVQHLYYLPIMFAAVRFGLRGGIATSLAAIVLYHLANAAPGSFQYEETDIIKMVLMVGIGVVTAKLAGDAEQLRRLAMTDDLTGLHNLRSFESHLQRLEKESRASRVPLSMLVLDLDHLKDLNDRYGHLAGAAAVRTVGHIIAGNLPPDAVACRYGGDEFAVVIPACGAAQAAQHAERLRLAVEYAATHARRFGPATTLSISAGVACLRFDERFPTADPYTRLEQKGEELFHAADQALYRAKAGGRNRVCVLNGASPPPRVPDSDLLPRL